MTNGNDTPLLNESCMINNRYAVIEHLGSGGMGSVYLVSDILSDSKTVALKQIHESKIDPQSLHAFHNEFKAMTRLKHPNLVQVFDFGYDQTVKAYYITMEFVNGYPLRELRDTGKRSFCIHTGRAETGAHDAAAGREGDRARQFVTGRQRSRCAISPHWDANMHAIASDANTFACIVSMFVQLLRALAFMHSRNIVHRDINSNNVMFCRNNQIKLMDFGLVDIEMDAVQRSKGTLAYMAPEVVKGSPDFRTDIFSLGITFYEVLTGSAFYENLSPQQIVHLLCNRDDFDRYRTGKIDKIESMQPVFEHLIAFDPQDRFQSCSEIIDAINRQTASSYPFETRETSDAYVLGAQFIGRETELNRLKESVASHDTAVILVKGEAGAGKSRLFYEFKNWCQLNTITFLEGTCRENVVKQFGPFLPVISELLLHAAESTIQRYGAELKKIIPDHPRLREVQTAFTRDSKTDHTILVKTIALCILDCIKQSPCQYAVYLNDLHWSDEGSVEVIAELLKCTEEGNTAIALHLYLSSRMQGAEKFLPLNNRKTLEIMQLPVFNEQTVQQYITAIFGERAVGPQLYQSISKIHTKVGGNPFFLQELIKSLIATGHLVRTARFWDLGTSLEQLPLPNDLEELVIARLNRLNLSLQEFTALQIIVLLNRSVSWQELHMICPIPVESLMHMEYNEIIRSRQKGTTVLYTIAHDLIRTAIYKKVTDYRTLHQQIGTSLEQIHANELDMYTEELAYHYHEAACRDKALHYLQRAIPPAMNMYENRKAVEFCNNVLQLLSTEENHTKKEILGQKSFILQVSGKIDESIRVTEELIQLAEETADTEQKAKGYYSLAYKLTEMQVSSSKSIACLERSLQAFTAIDCKWGITAAYNQMGYTCYLIEKDYDRAMNYLNKGMEVAETIPDEKFTIDLVLSIAEVYEAQGKFREALAYGKRVLEYSEKEELPKNDFLAKKNYLITLGVCGFLYFRAGELENALRCCEKQYVLADTLSVISEKAYALIKKADILFIQKKFNKAKTAISQAQEYFDEIHDKEIVFRGCITAAQIEFALQNKDTALQSLSRILENSKDMYKIAKLCYELWRMTRQEEYRIRSRDLYRSITCKTKNWLYVKRLKELEDNTPSIDIYQNTTVQKSRMSRLARPNRLLYR